MRKNIILWSIAFLVTIGSSVFQRLTGPTYPVSGKSELGNIKIEYSFPRSHSTSKDCEVKIKVENPELNAKLKWKRFKMVEDWNIEEMKYQNGYLIAYLPAQPAAGKLEYRVKIANASDEIILPPKKNVVIRFKDDVPSYFLIPHILFIFLGMLFSTRTGLEYFNKKEYQKLHYATLIFIILGGLIFGPIVQKFAFGAYWTGIPFGYDLTDNKTLIAFIFWLVPLFFKKNSDKYSKYIIIASIVTLIVFLIPHSLFGSELDYTTNRKINEF
ncbi:MAG: hypothetical protein N2043_09595 [Ignavibacterium sp.]|nr:hypothetical protein [Ignavibacterium sp.]